MDQDNYETRNNMYTVQIIVKGPNWATPFSTTALIEADGIEYKTDEVKSLLTTAWVDLLKKHEAQNE